MNKREALEICLKMWDYIAINGCQKSFASNALGLPIMIHYCSCCQYDRRGCRDCPIEWPGGRGIKGGCNQSYFGKWDNTTSRKKAGMWARKISDLALEALNKEFPEEPWETDSQKEK